MTTLSALRSLRSSFFPFCMTLGCLRMRSQPMCEKKKPLTALCVDQHPCYIYLTMCCCSSICNCVLLLVEQL
ncbi:hypothetical protein XENTR_v10014229 [Xenopus tropicalis]|nr:hypothetical protein XENTR_v10014229 [Xenopus tropicalis]